MNDTDTRPAIADVAAYMQRVGEAARARRRAIVARADTQAKNRALRCNRRRAAPRCAALLDANARDVAAARAAGHDAAFVDRLTLDRATAIDAMARGLRQIAALPDPVGEIIGPRVPPVRHPGRHDARAARRHRHHLRIAAQRDGRRRRRCASSRATRRSCAAARRRSTATARSPHASTKACATRACPRTPCSWSTRPIAPPSAI